jgi:hypothetical protein
LHEVHTPDRWLLLGKQVKEGGKRKGGRRRRGEEEEGGGSRERGRSEFFDNLFTII